MKDPELGAWLRQERGDRGWTRAEMARQLVKAAREAGDKAIPSDEGMERNLLRWEREGGVSERYRLYFCRAFGIHPVQFGPRPMLADVASPEAIAAFAPVPSTDPLPPRRALRPAAGPLLLATAAIAYRGGEADACGRSIVEREVTMAAHESSDHSAQHEQQGIGDTTAEQLHADLARLSRLTDSGAPLTAFLEARRVRDRIHRLLDRGLWPREQADLYFLLGCVNGLLGLNARRLGYPDSAEELYRAGWAYATAIGHGPLQGLLRAKHSNLLYWQGRYREASDLATDGLRYAPQGPVAAALHVDHARSAARLGDHDAARRAVELAHSARQDDHHDDLTDVGGEEFALSPPTIHAMAGSALAAIPDARQAAAAELETAITLYSQGHAHDQQHWFGGQALAGTDLAVLRLRAGALDGAATALGPVLALPPAQRASSLTTRLLSVREELTAPVFRNSPQARELGSQIEDYTRDAITAGLRTLTG